MSEPYVSAPSTWLCNKIKELEPDIKKSEIVKVLKLIDTELLDGLVEHTREKNREIEDKERRLEAREFALERAECVLKQTQEEFEKTRAEFEAKHLPTDERSRNGLLFAEKMIRLLDGINEQAQESMSYIMWAYFAGDKEMSGRYNPLKGEEE